MDRYMAAKAPLMEGRRCLAPRIASRQRQGCGCKPTGRYVIIRGMARKTKEQASQTRQRILLSALELFASKGYDNVSLNDIARRLQLTKGAVYWHFESKQALLEELLDSALRHFREQIDELMPIGELTYPSVAGMMIENAVGLMAERRGRQFFRLVKSGLKWSGKSMASIREGFLNNRRFGPKQAFETAIENDKRAGRVRADFRSEEASVVAMAVWDGLVQLALDGFLNCDLRETMFHAYAAIWDNMRLAGTAAMKLEDIAKKGNDL